MKCVGYEKGEPLVGTLLTISKEKRPQARKSAAEAY